MKEQLPLPHLVVNPASLVVLPGPQVGGLYQVTGVGQGSSVLGGRQGGKGGDGRVWCLTCQERVMKSALVVLQKEQEEKEQDNK